MVLSALLPGGPARDDPSVVADTVVEAEPSPVFRLVADALQDAEAARECAEFIGELLGLPMPETPGLRAARADPQLMVDRLRIALLDFFEALGSKGPLALVIEDLQWADPASLALLDDLLDRLADSPFALFVTTRPELWEAQPSLFSGRGLVRVDLRGLAASDVAALAASVAEAAFPTHSRSPSPSGPPATRSSSSRSCWS